MYVCCLKNINYLVIKINNFIFLFIGSDLLKKTVEKNIKQLLSNLTDLASLIILV